MRWRCDPATRSAGGAFHIGAGPRPSRHIASAISGASQAGIGALLTTIIGATSTAASSAGLRSTSVRSSKCPPIEWPIATCGPGVAGAPVGEQGGEIVDQRRRSSSNP